MTLVHVVLWKWRQSNFRELYTAAYVNIMTGMLRTHMHGMDYRVVCVTDDDTDIERDRCDVFPLWADHSATKNATGAHLPSCYRRLKLFDVPTQQAMGISEGERIVSLDLDAIITGHLGDTFTRIDQSGAIFAGWARRGTYHQRVFNGSFFSFRAGPEMQWMWNTFDPSTSPRKAFTSGFLGSDQSWLSMNLARHSDVCPINYPEFASYPQEVRRLGKIDRRTKIVFFHGARKPWHPDEMRAHPWIIKNWRAEPDAGLHVA